jgi:hypothetical protein
MQSGVRLKQSAFLVDLLALCGAIGIVIGGLIVRDRLPIIPLADGDTWRYLYPELSWLSGLGFQQTYGRDWLYPALLAGILNVAGDFCAITCVQRFLGLAGILVFWLTCRLWFRLLPAQKPILRWLCFVLTLASLALYALSSQQALLESTIRPEGMLAFFEMSYFYCLVSFFLARWKLCLTGSAIVFGAATLGLSYAVWLLKPSWSLSLAFTILCLAAGAFGRAKRLMRFGPLLAGAAAFVFLILLPHLLRFQKDEQLFFPFTLVSIHAPQILETKPDVVAPGTHNSGVADAIFYEELGKAYRTAKENPHNFDVLGFDTDYIQYRSGFFSTVMEREGWSVRELARACYSAYFRAWHQAPSSMLQKVWKQIRLFLFPRAADFYTVMKSIDLNHELTISRPFLRETELSPRVQKIYQSYIQSLEKPPGKESRPLGFRFLARLASHLTRITLPLQVVFFTTMIAACRSRQGRALRLGGLAAAAVLGATYGIVLAIAIGHSLDVTRFRVSYAPGLLLGLAMITNYLLILAWGTRNPDKQLSKTLPGAPAPGTQNASFLARNELAAAPGRVSFAGGLFCCLSKLGPAQGCRR